MQSAFLGHHAAKRFADAITRVPSEHLQQIFHIARIIDHGWCCVRRIRLSDTTLVETQHLKMLDQWARKNVQVLTKITRRARDKHHAGAVATDVIPQFEIPQLDEGHRCCPSFRATVVSSRVRHTNRYAPSDGPTA